jgi:hypothetical protein
MDRSQPSYSRFGHPSIFVAVSTLLENIFRPTNRCSARSGEEEEALVLVIYTTETNITRNVTRVAYRLSNRQPLDQK